MEATPSNVRKLQHGTTQEIYFMRFGPPSSRFVRDNEPLTSVFTHHGRPRQVSIAYAAATSTEAQPDPIQWDPDVNRPDWAYDHRRQFTEME